jgi:hypothetical protein
MRRRNFPAGRQAVDLARRSIHDRDATLDWAIPANLPTVRFDSEAIVGAQAEEGFERPATAPFELGCGTG